MQNYLICNFCKKLSKDAMPNLKLKVLLSLLAAISCHSYAGGLYLYEIGTEDIGLANAGAAARAADASVIANNPAGMTRLAGQQATFAGQALYGDAVYKLDGTGKVPGADPGNVIGWFPAASAFYSHSVDDKLKLGIGMYGNFGLGTEFGEWAGKRLMTDSALLALTFQPSAAYKINEQWSVGMGIGINYGLFSLKRDALSGAKEVKDHDWASNAKLGLMYAMNQQTRLGLAYTSATKYNFQIDSSAQFNLNLPNPIPGLPDISVSKTVSLPVAAMVNTPDQVMFSAFHQIDPTWAVMANLGWQNWSAFGDSSVLAGNRTVPSSGDILQDTWHTALGVQYQANPRLRINGGVAYDSSFYKDQNNTSLTMPSGAAMRLGTGAQYALDAKSSIGAAFEYIAVDSSKVPSELFSGGYDKPKMYFFTVNYSHSF
jgi:long-chain fatty acid transport protein